MPGYVFKPVIIEEKTQIKVWLKESGNKPTPRSPNLALDIDLGWRKVHEGWKIFQKQRSVTPSRSISWLVPNSVAAHSIM